MALVRLLRRAGRNIRGLVLWTVWTDAIKLRLIPADDIDRVADDIIASYPDPELEAFARHERAWYDSDGAEQTLVSGAGGRQAEAEIRKSLICLAFQ